METAITILAMMGAVNLAFGLVSVGRISYMNVSIHVAIGLLGIFGALYLGHWDVMTVLAARKAETVNYFIVCAAFLGTFIPLVLWDAKRKPEWACK